MIGTVVDPWPIVLSPALMLVLGDPVWWLRGAPAVRYRVADDLPRRGGLRAAASPLQAALMLLGPSVDDPGSETSFAQT
jgi:hypothetical protein